MASATRSLLSLFTIVCLMGAAVATAIGVYEANTDVDPNTTVDLKFIIPAAIGNTILVMVLVYLTATIKTITPGAKFFISFVLIAGLVAEIYLTTYIERMPQSIATYFIIVLNFLLRSFYVLQFVQDEWTRPFGVSVPTVQEVAKAVTPAALVRPVAAPVEKDRQSFTRRWDKIWERIRDSDKGLDMKSRNEAYFSIIKPAEKEGKTTNQVLEEAAKLLKYKDGTTVSSSDIIIGGRS